MEKFEKDMDISLDKDSDKKEIDIVEDDSFVVKSWKANTCWKWNIKIDNCPICREHLQNLVLNVLVTHLFRCRRVILLHEVDVIILFITTVLTDG